MSSQVSQCFSLLIFFLIVLLSDSFGQQIPSDRKIQSAIAKNTRSHSGVPGKNYWQNTAKYDIDVQFDPASNEVSGKVSIDYRNNSPDTLKTLLFKLYPNLYKANSMRNSSIAMKDLSNGVSIKSLIVGTKAVDSNKRKISGTNMSVAVEAISPGKSTRVVVEFSYLLNKGSFNRTGQIDSGSYLIAYFFPRIAVYDDMEGWNELPYLGKEEFYNDFCDFNVNITVPGDFHVWATGELKNAGEIYQPKYLGRIEKAATSDTPVDIITEGDLRSGNITRSSATNSWNFQAANVTDFAFAISKTDLWKSSSIVVDPRTGRRSSVNVVYSPKHSSYVPVIGYARKTVELISYKFPAIPFPYPHITIIDGLDAMEYPMLVNNLPFTDEKEMIQFTTHEVFHSIFPFYVGTNESRFSFMDEGWATMTEFSFLPEIAPNLDQEYDLSPVNDYAGLAEDVPVMTPTPQLYGKARFADKDLKPALSLYYLQEMLGEKLFLKGMQYFIHTWAGKHPSPYDFFNCFNMATGKNLDWYWDSWYFKKAVPDLRIAEVKNKGISYQVKIVCAGSAAVPVHLTIFFTNGTQKKISKDVSVWSDGRRKTVVAFSSKLKVKKMILGDQLDADINPADNLWPR